MRSDVGGVGVVIYIYIYHFFTVCVCARRREARVSASRKAARTHTHRTPPPRTPHSPRGEGVAQKQKSGETEKHRADPLCLAFKSQPLKPRGSKVMAEKRRFGVSSALSQIARRRWG